MGDVIRRNAATEDIFADVATTLVRARARGDKWQDLAEGYLAAITNLIQTTKARRDAASKELAGKQAVARAAAQRTGRVLGSLSDTIWNAVGRPGSDPALSVIFPGGISYYVDGNEDDQPQRLDLLVSLLESNVHPKLDPAVAQAAANSLRQEVAGLRAALEPARAARAEARLAVRVAASLARTAQIGLVNLKRRYKAEGFSEAEIHTVIPDRPRPAPANTAPASPTPAKSPPSLLPAAAANATPRLTDGPG
jgi:hypothetical protein